MEEQPVKELPIVPASRALFDFVRFGGEYEANYLMGRSPRNGPRYTWRCQPAWGQSTTASITGTVEDSAGAALPDATVTARDTERGTSSTTKTTGSGVFNFTTLPIGTYEVKAEAAGSDTTVQPPITLVLNERARVDFKMKVGGATNTVQVSSEAPQLQADTTQVSTLINATTITSIPLATRNYVELTLLAPGSITADNSTFTSGDNANYGGRPSINGNREESNNFILDGMDNNQTSENNLAVTPSPDAIQEFNLITSNASAEFGNFQGGGECLHQVGH